MGGEIVEDVSISPSIKGGRLCFRPKAIGEVGRSRD
jgi:hypothetical protein